MKLKITNIKVEDLVDKGSMFDKQDPLVIFTIGKEKLETERVTDGKTACSFTANFETDIDDKAYSSLEIEVEAFNAGKNGSKTHVGAGKIEMKAAIEEFNKSTPVAISLTYSGKEKTLQQGKVLFDAFIDSPPPPKEEPKAEVEKPKPVEKPKSEESTKVKEEPPVEEKKQQQQQQQPVEPPQESKTESVPKDPIKIRIDNIRASNLHNTGNMFDKQDPILTLKIGPKETFTTQRMKDAGTEASFPESFEMVVDASEYDNNFEFEVEVNNQSSLGINTQVGIGRGPVNQLIPEFNKYTKFTISLEYKGKKEGFVEMRGILEKKVEPVEEKLPEDVSRQPSWRKKKKTPEEEVPKKPEVIPEKPSPDGPLHTLFVKKIEASELKAVEAMMFDKNDNYIKISFGDIWNAETSVNKESGASSSWNYERISDKQMMFTPTLEQLKNGLLKVEAMDDNSLLSDALIGSAECTLKAGGAGQLVPKKEVNETVEAVFEVELRDKKEAVSGKVKVTIIRITTNCPETAPEKEPEPEVPIHTPAIEEKPPDFSEFKHSLSITRIAGKAMKNVEKMMFDKNDPYLQLKFGNNTWSYKTEVLDNAGSDPVWNYDTRKQPQMKFHVSMEELQSGKLLATAMDNNSLTAHAFIGFGEVTLPSDFVPLKAKESVFESEVVMELKDEKGSSTGSLVFNIQRRTFPKNAPPKEKAVEKAAEGKGEDEKPPSKPFTHGQLLVTRIVCHDLMNVEAFGGKDDPYVILQLGAETKQTEVLEEGGSNVCFDFLDIAFDVEKDIIDFEKLHVQVWDRNTMRPHKLIGDTETTLRSLLSKVGESVDVPLVLSTDKKTNTGTVTLFLTLKETELEPAEKENLPLDPALTEGILHINRIRCFELKDTKAILSDHVANPYVKLTLGQWKHQTETVSVKKGLPVFDHLDIETEVTAATLESEKLAVEVWDDEIVDKMIGTGVVSIRPTGVKLNKEIQLSVALSRDEVPSGRLVIYALTSLKPKKRDLKEIKVPEEFEQGYCRIKAITGHRLKNTELMGKQDPYVIVQFGEGDSAWKAQTEVLNEQGGEAHWGSLDFKFDFTRDQLLTEELKIVAKDSNTGFDALIGNGSSILIEAGEVLEKEVEIEIDLVDDKSKPSGKIVLLCSVHPTEKKEDLKLSEPLLKEGAGVVKFSKIVARDLATGNLISKPAPQLSFEYSDWNGKTSVGAGKAPVWEYPNLETSKMTVEHLQTQPMEVNLYENNKFIASGTIENMLLPGSKMDMETEIVVDLMNKKGAPAGKVTLTLIVSLPPVEEEEEELPPLDYMEAVLLVTYIKAEGLVNKELIGKQDPFVSLVLGGWAAETEVYPDAGGEVIWDNLDLRGEVDADVLLNEPMEVVVWDKNKSRSNVMIGKGEVSMKRVAYSIGKEVELLVNLKDGKTSKPMGKIVIRADLREKPKEEPKSLPEGFTSGILHVFRISTFNLPNTELIGKQDPFCIVTIGEFEDKTPVMDEAGSDAIFDFLDIKTEVTEQILENQKLNLEVWESNTTGNILLGTASTSIKKVTTYEEEVEFKLVLKNKKGENAGRALVFVKLEEKPPSVEEVNLLPIPEDFKLGVAYIRRIAGFNLKNTDFFLSKQDPFVVLTLNTWTGQTSVADNAGTNCMWDLLDLSIDVGRENVENAVFDVKVMNKNNLRGHSLIGSGTVPIRMAGVKLGDLVELSVDLKDNKGEKAGRIILYCEIKVEEDESSYKLPEDFQFGHFQVAKITAFNLKNTEFMGKQDPYVKLSLGQWEDKTFTQDDAGSDALWDFLAIECDVYRDTIENQKLQVTAWDENSGRSDVLIGTGEISLMKCGAHLDEQVELKTILLDEKGNPTGKIFLYATIKKPEPEPELPEDFKEGMLKVKRVSVFGLKNSEMFGLSKGDPYIKLQLGEAFNVQTKTLDNAGENPVWQHLDFETRVNVKMVKVEQLVVQAWDKNTMTSDKMLCSCELPIKRTGGKLEQEVELKGVLVTDKGEERGKVVVLAQLCRVAALSGPDLQLPEGFDVGLIRISQITAVGLVNKEILGKQDPFVCVTIGDWSETTDTLDNAGGNVTWPNLDMVAEVNKDILGEEKIIVTVYDENTTAKDAILGTGSASMRKLCARINNTYEVSIDLKTEGGVAAGRVTLQAKLSQASLNDLVDALPESAVTITRGQLQIVQIDAFDLKGGDADSLFGGKQDPYIELTVGEWSGQTEVKENAGRKASWQNIEDMELPVDGDTLKFKRMKVIVKDQNSKIMGDTLMSTGDFSLRKIGAVPLKTEVSTTVRLKDKRGRPAGRLLIKGVILPLPEPITVDPAYAQMLGKLQLKSCEVTQLTNNAMFGNQDLLTKFRAADWMLASKVNKAAGTESSWDLNEQSTRMAVTQILLKGLKVEVLCQTMTGESKLGEATLPVEISINQPEKWVELKADLKNMSTKKFAGKFVLLCRFAPDGSSSDGDDPFGIKPVPVEPPAPVPVVEPRIDELIESQGDLTKKVSDLEDSIKREVQKELAEEHRVIMEAMKQQNEQLQQALQKLSKEVASMEKQPKGALDGLKVQQVTDVKLPADVKKWRNAHVQAWIGFQMELPQYMEPFQQASIDGLVLIKHVDQHTLASSLEITDPLHCGKILEGIEQLKDRQQQIDAAAEKQRLKRLEEKRAEDARKRAMMEAAERRAQKQKEADKEQQQSKKKKKKKKLATTAPAGKMFFGEVPEQNVLERTKIERDMRQYRAEKAKQQGMIDSKNKTWKFEYTGEPKQTSDNVWNRADPFEQRQVGSKAYKKAMTLDILSSRHFRASTPVGDEHDASDNEQSQRPAPGCFKIQNVPKNCSPEELFAVVQGAMLDVSSWLVEVEKMNFRKQQAQDSDLIDYNDETMLRLIQQETTNYLEPTNSATNKPNEAASSPRYNNVDNEGEDDEPPPPSFDEIIEKTKDSSLPVEATDDEDDLPAYDDLMNSSELVTPTPLAAGSVHAPMPPSAKLAALLNTSSAEFEATRTMPELDRTRLIFNALIGQRNNNAHWLGTNAKLTRMKLFGGFESLLRLRVDWPQFDALWTTIDRRRSGDIDFEEFKHFFDLDAFERLAASSALGLTITAKEEALQQLTNVLYELCDALRHAGFTIVEMFSGFDRNASGDISISEFCSMLRLVVGSTNPFNKRLIYQAVSVLDANGDKKITLDELLRFIYRIWKNQLDDLAAKVAQLDDRMTGDEESIRKILLERTAIKDAIKRNFPREWRDRLEREGSGGHALPGPFQTLLARMNIAAGGTAGAATLNSTTGPLSSQADSLRGSRIGFDTTAGTADGGNSIPKGSSMQSLNLGSPHRTYRPSEMASPMRNGFMATAPPSAVSPTQRANKAGQNQVKRFKIKMPAGVPPSRSGTQLSVPVVRDLNNENFVSAEVAGKILKDNAPFEGFG